MNNIIFGYNPKAKPVLNNVTLSIEEGQRIGVIGHSGCGKSTLLSLLSGLYEPWKGEILFNGRSINEISNSFLRTKISMVLQYTTLMPGSIRDAITLFTEGYDEMQIIEAAKDACIHEEIMCLPGGYSHLLIENGSNISGGQRQRIEVARALVGNPSLIILDEALNAIDEKTEMEVYNNIIKRNCSVLLVTHRINSISNFDKIVVLNQGHIVEVGSHSDLMNANGFYSQMQKFSIAENS